MKTIGAWISEHWKNYDIYQHEEFVMRGIADIGCTRDAFVKRLRKKLRKEGRYDELLNRKYKTSKSSCDLEWSVDFGDNDGVVVTKSPRIKTLEDAIKHANVDLSIWEVDRHVINSWETSSRHRDQDLSWTDGTLSGHSKRKNEWTTNTNYQVKVWLKRKSPEITAMETLLKELSKKAPVVKKYKTPRNTKNKRCLELDIMDPHLALKCYKPESDQSWSVDKCKNMYMTMLMSLCEEAEVYGPFDEILFPFGNDFLHSDSIFGQTTKGTRQPEALAWHHAFVEGEQLIIDAITYISRIAPTHVKIIPGNHARQTEFSMGRVIKAYFRNNDNVVVDATANPYKFHRFGVNLIGFEHGHNVKPQIRLAALMANECRDAWSQTVYREWHLGDQHRKGSSKPSVMEEQGVSVEFLPGLTAPNEWHRLKSYNWQKRAAMAFVWDYTAGPISRLQKNINSYTGKIMGAI